MLIVVTCSQGNVKVLIWAPRWYQQLFSLFDKNVLILVTIISQMGFLSSVFILNAVFDQETAWDDIYNRKQEILVQMLENEVF